MHCVNDMGNKCKDKLLGQITRIINENKLPNRKKLGCHSFMEKTISPIDFLHDSVYTVLFTN